MTVEYIRYQLTSHTASELLDAYRRAAAHLKAAPECVAYELSQCAADPNCFILRIEWTSQVGHLEGFRKGPHFPPFLAEIRPFVDEIEEMRHYQPMLAHPEIEPLA